MPTSPSFPRCCRRPFRSPIGGKPRSARPLINIALRITLGQYLGAELFARIRCLGVSDDGLPKDILPYFTMNLANYDWSEFLWVDSDPQSDTDYDEGWPRCEYPSQNACRRLATHGSYMPGVDNPYVANDPEVLHLVRCGQSMVCRSRPSCFGYRRCGACHPLSPYCAWKPVQKGTMTSLAKIDATATNSRDLHCRECHAKGQIAANPGVAYTLGDGTTLGAAAPTFWDV